MLASSNPHLAAATCVLERRATVEFEYSEKTKYALSKLEKFMYEHVYPNEETYHRQHESFGADRWRIPPIVEDLKRKAREAGLWNLFLPESELGAGYTNLEYAPL
jgi:acyl-CoA dehydrogenase